jgi:hypothetical protein
MWQPWTLFRTRTALLVLESSAAHAGSAMACAFSSSAEFEAAVIRSRLDAGVYGPKRRQRYVLCAGAATGMLIVLSWIIAPF